MVSLRHRFAFTCLKPTTTIVGPDPSLVLTNPLVELAGLVFPLMNIEFEGRNVPWMYTQQYGRRADGSPLALWFVEDGSMFRLDDRCLQDVRAFHIECGLGPSERPRT